MITTLATSQNFHPKKKKKRQEKKKSDVKCSAFVQGGLQLHFKKILARFLCNRREKRTQEGL
jgi:hypothetical protein